MSGNVLVCEPQQKSYIFVTIHGCCPARCFYALAHENPEAASAIWGRMFHICASRSVLLFTELRTAFFAGLWIVTYILKKLTESLYRGKEW